MVLRSSVCEFPRICRVTDEMSGIAILTVTFEVVSSKKLKHILNRGKGVKYVSRSGATVRLGVTGFLCMSTFSRMSLYSDTLMQWWHEVCSARMI